MFEATNVPHHVNVDVWGESADLAVGKFQSQSPKYPALPSFQDCQVDRQCPTLPWLLWQNTTGHRSGAAHLKSRCQPGWLLARALFLAGRHCVLTGWAEGTESASLGPHTYGLIQPSSPPDRPYLKYRHMGSWGFNIHIQQWGLQFRPQQSCIACIKNMEG